MFSCFIWYLIDKDKSILTCLYYTLVLSFLALVIDGYIQYFTGVNLSDTKFQLFVFHLLEIINNETFPLLFALF